MSKRKSNSELEKQQAVWYNKLKAEGFVDIEDSRQNLKQHNTRTIAYRNQDIILDFYLKLDKFLNERTDLKATHRKILELYSSGAKIIVIARQVRLSRMSIYRIITRYKREILNGHLI